MEYKEVVLDLTKCEHVGRIHYVIQDAFDFPDWYGKNWSAFKDFLIEYPASKITVIGIDVMPKTFVGQIDILKSILQDYKAECERTNDHPFDYEFK